MKIAELRNKPFVLLVLKDGADDGYFSPEFIRKTQNQLADMSLRIASDNLSIIYADQIKKGCEIVLGIINLGLLSHCDNDTEKAKEIIKTQGIVYCFRSGWAKYSQLKQISENYFQEINLSMYALSTNDTSDIRLMHAELLKNAYESIKLLEVYKSISTEFAANVIIPENDEEYLKFELQKLLNSAIALLLIDSDKKVFNYALYTDLITYLTTTEKSIILEKFEQCVKTFTKKLPLTTKTYLESIKLICFPEFKGLIEAQENIDIYIQEILELSVNVANEINDDFEGGYDFGIDDLDDIAYLKPE